MVLRYFIVILIAIFLGYLCGPSFDLSTSPSMPSSSSDSVASSSLSTSSTTSSTSSTASAPPVLASCDLARLPAENLSFEKFYQTIAGKAPIVVTGASNNSYFSKITSTNALRRRFGNVPVMLSTANTYSHEKQTMSFAEYLDHHMQDITLENKANTTWYLFGDIIDKIWDEQLLIHYNAPKYCEDVPTALSFGLGAHNSGVPFHFHGPGFSEVIRGAKHWFLYPAGKQNVLDLFDGDRTTYDWYVNDYPNLEGEDKPLHCLISPGEALYFPHGWYHATLNVGESVFVSAFTDELALDPFPPYKSAGSRSDQD